MQFDANNFFRLMSDYQASEEKASEEKASEEKASEEKASEEKASEKIVIISKDINVSGDVMGGAYLEADYANTYGTDEDEGPYKYTCTVKGCTAKDKMRPRIQVPPPRCDDHPNTEMVLKK